MGPSLMRRSMKSTIQPTSRPRPHAAGDEPGEGQDTARQGGRTPMHDDGGGELKSEQAGSVVDEALAFEDVDDAGGQSDATGDGGSGDGVGGGDHGAEGEAEAPIESGKDVGRDQGDATR